MDLIKDAIKHDKVEKLREIYDSNPESVISFKTLDNKSAYHLAIKHRSIEIIKYLLTTKASIDQNPLLYCVDEYFNKNKPEALREILRLFVKDSRMANFSDYFLVLLYNRNENDLLDEFLKYSYRFDEIYDSDTYLAQKMFLYEIVKDSNLDLLKLVIENCGCEPSRVTSPDNPYADWFGDEESLLMIAVRFNHLNIVEYLLEAGADIFFKIKDDMKAIHMAFNLNILKALIAAGADPEAVDSEGMTLLHRACLMLSEGCVDIEVIDFLVNDYGVDINKVANDGRKPRDYIHPETEPERIAAIFGPLS